ncbi:acetyl-CoA hydrolase/transferase family protein [Actinophytocola sp.]|uniref:acetyl-CoA hydrolase/transferase family protein n=1 Tax=Actinophytocola sp. TaxID=1872138 RepID=UPI003D6A6FA5
MSEPSWRAVYRDRCVDARAAIQVVEPGSLLVFTSYGGEPQELIDALVTESRLAGCRGFQAVRGTREILADPIGSGGFRLITYAPAGQAVAQVANGHADYLPCSVYRACRWLEDGVITPDVALVNVSTPDEDGYCSFGTSVDFTAIAALRARTVVAQVNSSMPKIRGVPRIHVTQLDRIVEVAQPPTPATPPAVDEVAERIGAFIAELVPDGATLEVGIGGVPDATLRALKTHRDLGIHSGLLTDGMMWLYHAGAITGARKPVDRGLMIANQVIGTADLFAFAESCPAVEMRSATYTHDPTVLAKLPRFTALNSALQVDLRGQVNAESLRGRQVAGTGGSLDFAIGAALSPGGRSIVALPSTAGGGRYSRIVARLTDDPVATLPATLVDYVVTEYGVAELRGHTAQERAQALLSICHPDHRDRVDKEQSQ